MYDFEKRMRIEKMNADFDKSLAELEKALDDDSTESEDEERPIKQQCGNSSNIEAEISARLQCMSKKEKAEFVKQDQHFKKSLLLQKAKEGREENTMRISVIEDRVNHFKPLTDAQWKFLGVNNPTKFQNSLLKSISGKVGASPYKVRDLANREIVRDNPGTNVMPGGKLPKGNFSMVTTDSATLGDMNMARIYGQFRPEQNKKIGSIQQNVEAQGRGYQDFIPKGGTASVRYSNTEVLSKIIQRTQAKRQFLSQVQVCEIESLINRGGRIKPEILRRLFDETDDGKQA